MSLLLLVLSWYVLMTPDVAIIRWNFFLTRNVFFLQDLFAAMGGAQLNAAGITVSEMVSMTNLFDIAGPGSVAQIMDVMITDNDFRTTDPPPLWTGVNVRDNAMATATEFVVEDSTNIRYLFGAQGGSMISVDTVDAVNIVGGRQVVSPTRPLTFD